MTALPNPAEPATERSRRGGRAGKRAGAAGAFEQPPFRQLRNPLQPTRLISEDELESIHLASLRVLKEIGVDVLHDGARHIMKEHGADVREGSERVRFGGARPCVAVPGIGGGREENGLRAVGTPSGFFSAVSKKGSSSAIAPSTRGGALPRESESVRATSFAKIARCSSLSDVKTRS